VDTLYIAVIYIYVTKETAAIQIGTVSECRYSTRAPRRYKSEALRHDLGSSVDNSTVNVTARRLDGNIGR
jgi:hypothetical protein